jgi:hypothetical protein
LFQEFTNFVAVAHRHKNIGENQIRNNLRGFADASFTVPNGDNVYALAFEGERHHLLNIAVVVRY